MSTTPTFEGFSISHAAILNGSTGAEAATVYGVRNGTVATDSGNFENTGDDVVLSEWFWINFANVTVEAGFITYDTLSLVTGSVVQSSGLSPNDYYSLPLWTQASMNQPFQPMAIRVPARDTGGALRTIDFVLYHVQFMPFNFTGPSYKNGLTISLNGRALMTSVDEIGAALPASYPKTIGRLVSVPGQQTGIFTAIPFAGIEE